MLRYTKRPMWLLAGSVALAILAGCGVPNTSSTGTSSSNSAASVPGQQALAAPTPTDVKQARDQYAQQLQETARAGTPVPKDTTSTEIPTVWPLPTEPVLNATPLAGGGALIDNPQWLSSAYLFTNLWYLQQGDTYLLVYAGEDNPPAEKPWPSQGMLLIETRRDVPEGQNILASDTYPTPTRSGQARIVDASVSMAAIRLTVVTAQGDTFVFNVTTRSWEQGGASTPTSTALPTAIPTMAPTATPTTGPVACNLYPIALDANLITGVTVGTGVKDILNGAGQGNFGWLTWTGKQSLGVLTYSLTAPSDSASYINPDDPTDHAVSAGDWVQGRPGVDNSQSIRDALESLKANTIIVPIWDQATGQGSNLRYRVASFAQVKITNYRLPSQNRISIIYQGPATCSAP